MPESFLRRVIRRRPAPGEDVSIQALAAAVRDLANARQKQTIQLKKITDHGFAGEVDLLSIDIDSYEYWGADDPMPVDPSLTAIGLPLVEV